MKEIDGKKYYTAEEVADKFGMNTQTVRRWIHSDKLPAVKLGKGFWIYDEDVKKLMSTEKANLTKTDKDNDLKSAILALLNSRTTAFERKSISVDVGNDEETLRKNHLFAKAVENINKDEYEYIFSQIYSVAFKRGFNAGYEDFYENIKNLVESNQSDWKMSKTVIQWNHKKRVYSLTIPCTLKDTTQHKTKREKPKGENQEEKTQRKMYCIMCVL